MDSSRHADQASVAELISSWRASSPCPQAGGRIVDLNKVTSIDKSGEEALSMIMRDGATVVASGVYTRHLLDELRAGGPIERYIQAPDPDLTPAPADSNPPVLEKALKRLS